ncbi:unnamed protein product [Pleuronectes platessa]|uniref:Uncharacterized protein n=1 Tax=Pleuronectes platessa TaxID=8262 RepID=A0A9N7VBR3_PLEPL|nr:unnamed protein product [Pleuronectes platessa]
MPQSLASSDQENVHHVHRSSPVGLLVPAAKLKDLSASPDAWRVKPENKDLTKMLNQTISPIGTPERFKKLMPLLKAVALAVSCQIHWNPRVGVSAGDLTGISSECYRTVPELAESKEPRLTFFVSNKVVVHEAVASEAEEDKGMVKKVPFHFFHSDQEQSTGGGEHSQWKENQEVTATAPGENTGAV